MTATNAAGSNTVTKSNLITVTAGAYNEIITYPLTGVAGAQYTASVTGGKPNTTFTVSIDGGVPGAPLSLDATGNWTITEANGFAVGAHTATFVFAGTGHTQTKPFTVTGGYNEVITHPSSVTVGSTFTWSISGGMPNTTFTVTRTGSPPGAPETLNSSGTFSRTEVWTEPAGAYTFTFTFQGTGHVRTASGNATGSTFNEIITRPSTVVQGAQYTVSVAGGMPNTTFTISVDGGPASPPYTLDASGAWTNTEAMGYSVGTHSFLFTFQGTGHTQTFQGTVTTGSGGYNEVITHPSTAIYGQPFTFSVSGGMPNTTGTYSIDGGPPSAPLMLSATGTLSQSIPWDAPAGTHLVVVTFQGTGHTQNFTVTSTGGSVVYNEIWNHPTTVAYGASYTTSATGGMPNTSLIFTIDGVQNLAPYPTFDANGNWSTTEIMTLQPGTHTFRVDFQGTGHSQTYTGQVTGTAVNTITVGGTITNGGTNEIFTAPTSAIFGIPWTWTVREGVPNTQFTVYVDGIASPPRMLGSLGEYNAYEDGIQLPIGPHSFQIVFSATGRTINISANVVAQPAAGQYREILTIPSNARYNAPWSYSIKGGKPNTRYTVNTDGQGPGAPIFLDATGSYTETIPAYGIAPGYHTFQFAFQRI